MGEFTDGGVIHFEMGKGITKAELPGHVYQWMTGRIAALETEVERLREKVKLLTFQLDTLRRHPEFHNLDVLAQKGAGDG